MKKTRFHSCLAFALSAFAAGCAGQLDQNLFPPDGPSGVGGSTGTPSTATGSGTATSGAGGSAPLPPPDPCVMTSMKSCGQVVCHNATATAQAGLNLTIPALTGNYKALYYDKMNAGFPMAGYCGAGAGKLVDSANPMASMIYTKVLTQEERDAMMKPPCGDPMPSIPPISTAADKACILKWVNDVIAGSKATP